MGVEVGESGEWGLFDQAPPVPERVLSREQSPRLRWLGSWESPLCPNWL